MLLNAASLLLRRQQLRRDYAQVFDSAAGQRVLADLMKFCGTGRELMVPGQGDSTAYNVGRYRVAQHVAGILQMDERAMLERAREAIDVPQE